MSARQWIYVVVGMAMVVVVALAAYDQVLVDYGDDSSYLLGKATPAVTWVLTLATPFALMDFFSWLRRSRGGTPVFWWATAGVLASLLIGWYVARGWSLDWLVERDIEVSFGRDEFLGIVVGLWCACLVALLVWLALRSQQVDQQTTQHQAAIG